MTTQYKIASTYKEWKDCHSLLQNDDKFAYPTVLAVRDDKPIGMISTANGDNHLFLSYVVVNSIFTFISLWKLYEKTMLGMGVDSYMFNIEKDNKKLINTVESMIEVKPFGDNNKQLFYIRRM